MELNYKKKFIILKNKYSNIKGYKAKGHVKIEIKGAHTYINVNIENAQADTSYTLTMISEDVIDLGKIYTDSYGRTKSELVLKTDDFLYGELEQSAVLIHRNQDVLLGEYLDKEDGKIEEFIDSLKNEELMSESAELEAEAEPHAEPEPELEPQPILEPEPQAEPEYQPQPEPEPDSQFEPEPEFEEVEYEFQEDFIENINPVHEEFTEDNIIEEVDYIEDEDLGYSNMNQTTDYVLSILRYFPYADPFKEELHDHNWWRIEYNHEAEDSFLPYFNYLRDTNASNLMNEYGHYLFGLYNQGDNVKYYIFGVPGKFSLEEHPNDGKSGFETWFEGVDEVGYWLLYIDPRTGQVIESLDPLNP